MSEVSFSTVGEFQSDVEISLDALDNGNVRVIVTLYDEQGIIDQSDHQVNGQREDEDAPESSFRFVYHGKERNVIDPVIDAERGLLSGVEQESGMFKHFSISKIGA